MVSILVIFVVVRFVIAIIPGISSWLLNLKLRLNRLFSKRSNAEIFHGSFLEVKAFYLQQFRQVPNINYMDSLNPVRVFEYINAGKAGRVLAIHQRTYFNWKSKKQEAVRTVFSLEGKIMIELGYDHVEVLYLSNNFAYAEKLIENLSTFRAPEKETEYEINIITLTSNGLELKQLAIKQQQLDIDLCYNDDFKPVDRLIKERLEKENDKGIVLLHGLPGTGKTTYLRHLIGGINKKILFVSPSVAGNLMNPEFIDLLIDNPNSILVIEDAENVIMDRKYSSNNSVSNLLNISDGLLSDCLDVQIICTFNSALNLVDNALLRKGRLIAKYEFGKLETEKGQRLSDHLGLHQKITMPMTLAELTHPEEPLFQQANRSEIGFRRVEQLIEN